MMMPIDEKTEAKCKKELQVYLDKISLLEKENQELRQEVNRLRSQVNALKAHDLERKSILWKKLQNSMVPSLLPHDQDQDPFKIKLSAAAAAPKEEKAAAAAAAKLPVRSILVGGHKELGNGNCNKLESKSKMEGATPPPPPPPPPSKLLLSRSAAALCRVPEVMEFYRSLMKKRDAHAHALAQHHKDKRISSGSMGNPKNMIGEIENRSSYLFNIKSDVETYRELINFLAREVESASFSDISQVESFVKWIDGELSSLVDERAVLKHFPNWPERKADALREAACSYRDLKTLHSQVSSYKIIDTKQQQLLSESLRKLQALQDRLETSVNNVERVRDGLSNKYRQLHIPWQWMLDTGLIRQLKFDSVTLAKQYMIRIARELQSSEASSQEEDDLLLQGVRFAYRVHQFAGGFDTDAREAFEELRRIGCQKL
ncbi:hypothetical protein M9H77_05916 [Catharanthus roseus]|uniref:Uncharacterized protein n=1 Tax=Catharanthus roseus TaxID=4058 RepID=A0ACC0BQW4_CATRO|nr:hypothetical protein M9H77_05916 [Catharanthus roseus]